MKRKSDGLADGNEEEPCKKPKIVRDVWGIILLFIPLESWNVVSRTCKLFDGGLRKRLIESRMEGQIGECLTRYMERCVEIGSPIYIEHLFSIEQFKIDLVYPGLAVYEESSKNYSNTIKLLRVRKPTEHGFLFETLESIVKARNLETFTEILEMETDEWNFSSLFPRELRNAIESIKLHERVKWTKVMKYSGGDNAIHNLIRLAQQMRKRFDS